MTYSKYIYLTIYMLKIFGFTVHLYNNPFNTYGTIQYRSKTIWLDCPVAKYTLFTLYHELGHYILYILTKMYIKPRTQIREKFADLFGYSLLCICCPILVYQNKITYTQFKW